MVLRIASSSSVSRTTKRGVKRNKNKIKGTVVFVFIIAIFAATRAFTFHWSLYSQQLKQYLPDYGTYNSSSTTPPYSSSSLQRQPQKQQLHDVVSKLNNNHNSITTASTGTTYTNTNVVWNNRTRIIAVSNKNNNNNNKYTNVVWTDRQTKTAFTFTTTNDNTQRRRPLALKVPFYVYTNNPLDWSNDRVQCDHGEAVVNDDYKHADDYWMLQSALKHPMRTLDPSKAVLFYVPTLLNIAQQCRNMNRTMCVNIQPGQKEGPKPPEQQQQHKQQHEPDDAPSTTTTTINSTATEQQQQHKQKQQRHKQRILPVVVNYDRHEQNCFGPTIKGDNAYKYVEYWLGQQEWFQNNQGRDHVIVASHWSVALYYGLPMWPSSREQNPKQKDKFPNLRNCNVISQEGIRPIPYEGRYSLPACYVGTRCESTSSSSSSSSSSTTATATTTSNNDNTDQEATTTTTRTYKKTHNFAMVASLHQTKPLFQTRRNICQWLSEIKRGTKRRTTTTRTTDTNNNHYHYTTTNASSSSSLFSLEQQRDRKRRYSQYSISLCGEGEQCPALADAKYGFHARGDSWGSNRVMDTLLSRTIPLFTNEEQYKILPPFVPWRNLTYLVNVDSKEAFEASLEELLSKSSSSSSSSSKEEEYEAMQQRIEEYMPIFDHTTIYRFDAYMAEFAKLQGYQ